jgi:hypothetical protein
MISGKSTEAPLCGDTIGNKIHGQRIKPTIQGPIDNRRCQTNYDDLSNINNWRIWDMDMPNVEPITYSKVFTEINGLYPQKIIDVKGEIIIPLDERTKFMFERLLGRGSQSYFFIHDPKELFPNITDKGLIDLIRKAMQENGADFVYIQTKVPSSNNQSKYTNTRQPVTEALVELMTLLYFRAEGYMVQCHFNSYAGVDDIFAWKSPLVEKLRAHRLIEYGCFVDELELLRKFGRVNQVREEKSIYNELIIVEAESSIANAIRNNGGMNQLIGKEWDNSDPKNEYRGGAKQRMVAKKLFITFPVCFRTRSPAIKSFEEVVSVFGDRQKDQKVGIICWEPTTYYFKDSAIFQHPKMTEELSKFETHAMQLLLKNFYFDELLSLMQKLKIEFKGRTKDEVFSELENKIQEGNVDIIISELDRVLT